MERIRNLYTLDNRLGDFKFRGGLIGSDYLSTRVADMNYKCKKIHNENGTAASPGFWYIYNFKPFGGSK